MTTKADHENARIYALDNCHRMYLSKPTSEANLALAYFEFRNSLEGISRELSDLEHARKCEHWPILERVRGHLDDVLGGDHGRKFWNEASRLIEKKNDERDYEAKARQSETNRADELAARVRHLENLAHDSLLYLQGLTDPKAAPETLDGQARVVCEELKQALNARLAEPGARGGP